MFYNGVLIRRSYCSEHPDTASTSIPESRVAIAPEGKIEMAGLGEFLEDTSSRLRPSLSDSGEGEKGTMISSVGIIMLHGISSCTCIVA